MDHNNGTGLYWYSLLLLLLSLVTVVHPGRNLKGKIRYWKKKIRSIAIHGIGDYHCYRFGIMIYSVVLLVLDAVVAGAGGGVMNNNETMFP